jgi:hypothetical protein
MSERQQRDPEAPDVPESTSAEAADQGPADRRKQRTLRPDPGAAEIAPASADQVDLVGESVEEVRADEVSVRRGAIGRAWADEVEVSQGAVGMARAREVSVVQGAVGAAVAGEVHVTQGIVSGVIARDAYVGQAFVRGMIAGTVHVERPSGVLFLFARKVEGNVRVLFDWRGALAFGAAFGFVSALVRFRFRRRQ